MDYKNLLKKAKQVSKKAYAPYSNFKVGACLVTENDTEICGCNFENSSYGLTICAERNAVGTAIAKGHKAIKAIAIYSPNQDDCTPCGACRQVLAEFQSKNGMEIITEIDNEPHIYQLNDLLPKGFKL